MALKEAATGAFDILKKVMEEKLTSTNVDVSLEAIPQVFHRKKFQNFLKTSRKDIDDKVHFS